MPRKIWNTRGKVEKIAPECSKILHEIKKTNNLKSIREASLNLARAYNFKIKGQKISIKKMSVVEDIVF